MRARPVRPQQLKQSPEMTSEWRSAAAQALVRAEVQRLRGEQGVSKYAYDGEVEKSLPVPKRPLAATPKPALTIDKVVEAARRAAWRSLLKPRRGL